MLRLSISAMALLGSASLVHAVDLNRVVPGRATIVQEFGGKESSLVKEELGDNAKAKELVKFETGDRAKEKELLKTVKSNKDKERALVREIVPIEATITVTPSRSRIYRAKVPIERFSISNPNILEVIQYSPLEFELMGRNPGACSLTIWFEDDEKAAASGAERVLRLGVRVGRDDGRD